VKKLFKIIFAVVGVLVLLAVIAICIFISYVDVLAERAVERGATTSLGVATTVDSIHVALISTTGKIHNLKVVNPAGFDTPHFLKIEEGTIALDAMSAIGQRVVIPTMSLNNIDINLEEKDGRKNFNDIIANLKKYQATLPDSKQEAAGRPGKKFVIHEVIIKNVTVHTDTLHGFGGKLQRIDLNIPELVLKDIGNDSDNGVAMEQVTGAIMTSLFEAIAKNGVGVLPLTVLGALTDGVIDLSKLGGPGVKILGGVAGEAVKAVGDVGKGAIEAVGETGKGAVQAVGEVGKGLGGLIVGEDEKKKK
jgi:hypothetical protein